MRKGFTKKLVSVLLASSMTVGLTSCGLSTFTGSNYLGLDENGRSEKTVTLTVYNQLANYSGEQQGWAADVMLDKFNVKLNIVPESDGTFQTRMESGNLGDIIIWGSNPDQYEQAVKKGLLFDMEEDDMLTQYAPYVAKNYTDALNTNRELTSKITEDENNKTLYGWGTDVAASSDDHAAFFYTWDVRWDLYKKLGCPKVKNMDDMLDLLVKMQKEDPTDDAGNKTYAVSLWPDWDDSMVMYVKATATCYYGYDELGIGVYDPQTGDYHDALEENGPYLEMLKFYNKLYQKGLVDPDSMTQTYDQMSEKVVNGGVLFSIFNYSGSLGFNTDAHLSKGEYMYCMKPDDATPAVYGLSTLGGTYKTAIGAQCEYPELAMEVLNYWATPEGRLTYAYGPKDECWYYDEEGYTRFTDLGLACTKNLKTQMTGHGGTFADGQLQMAACTYALDSVNPESKVGEKFNKTSWVKEQDTGAKYEIQQQWQDFTGCKSLDDYMEKDGKYVVQPGTDFLPESKDDDLRTKWSQTTGDIKQYSWNAIYAKDDATFNKIVDKMIKSAKGHGYEECKKWSQEQAAIRYQKEQALSN